MLDVTDGRMWPTALSKDDHSNISRPTCSSSKWLCHPFTGNWDVFPPLASGGPGAAVTIQWGTDFQGWIIKGNVASTVLTVSLAPEPAAPCKKPLIPRPLCLQEAKRLGRLWPALALQSSGPSPCVWVGVNKSCGGSLVLEVLQVKLQDHRLETSLPHCTLYKFSM